MNGTEKGLCVVYEYKLFYKQFPALTPLHQLITYGWMKLRGKLIFIFLNF